MFIQVLIYNHREAITTNKEAKDMRHFWFTDEKGECIVQDHRGTIKGAIKRAKDFLKKYPEMETIYINEGEDIIEVVHK